MLTFLMFWWVTVVTISKMLNMAVWAPSLYLCYNSFMWVLLFLFFSIFMGDVGWTRLCQFLGVRGWWLGMFWRFINFAQIITSKTWNLWHLYMIFEPKLLWNTLRLCLYRWISNFLTCLDLTKFNWIPYPLYIKSKNFCNNFDEFQKQILPRIIFLRTN